MKKRVKVSFKDDTGIVVGIIHAYIIKFSYLCYLMRRLVFILRRDKVLIKQARDLYLWLAIFPLLASWLVPYYMIIA